MRIPCSGSVWFLILVISRQGRCVLFFPFVLGVTYALLVDILLPGPFPLHLLRLNAVKAQEKKENFSILFRFLEQKHGIVVDFDAATLTEGPRRNAMHLALLSVLQASITQKQICLLGNKTTQQAQRYGGEIGCSPPSSSCSSFPRSRVPADGVGSSTDSDGASNARGTPANRGHDDSTENTARETAQERTEEERGVEFLPIRRELTTSQGLSRASGSLSGKNEDDKRDAERQKREADYEDCCYSSAHDLPIKGTAEKNSRGGGDIRRCVPGRAVPAGNNEHGQERPTCLHTARAVVVTAEPPETSSSRASEDVNSASHRLRTEGLSQGERGLRYQAASPPRSSSPENKNRSAHRPSSASTTHVPGGKRRAGKGDPAQVRRGSRTPPRNSSEATIRGAGAEAAQGRLELPPPSVRHSVQPAPQARADNSEDDSPDRCRTRITCRSRVQEIAPGDAVVRGRRSAFSEDESEESSALTVETESNVLREVEERRRGCSYAAEAGDVSGSHTTDMTQEQASHCSYERDTEDEDDRQRLLAELREEEALEDPEGLQAKRRLAIAECREAILEMQRQIQQRWAFLH